MMNRQRRAKGSKGSRSSRGSKGSKRGSRRASRGQKLASEDMTPLMPESVGDFPAKGPDGQVMEPDQVLRKLVKFGPYIPPSEQPGDGRDALGSSVASRGSNKRNTLTGTLNGTLDSVPGTRDRVDSGQQRASVAAAAAAETSITVSTTRPTEIAQVQENAPQRADPPVGVTGALRRGFNNLVSNVSGSLRRKPTGASSTDMAHIKDVLQRYKVLVTGYEGGNSALVDRFIFDKFNVKDHTVGGMVDRKLTRKAVIDEVECLVELYDVSPDDKHEQYRERWYKWADAIVLVFSLTDMESLTAVQDLYPVIQKLLKKKLPFALVGTRADDAKSRKVEREAARWAQDMKMLYREVSAKTGAKVEEPFYEVVKQITTSDRRLLKEFFTSDETLEQVISEPTGFRKGGTAVMTNGEFIWSWEDFIFEEILGEGSFSKVYLARWRDGGFKVAIKVLVSTEKFNETDIKNEYEVLRILNVPQVTRFYGLCFKKKEIWLLMEYCDVGSLYCVMRVFNTVLSEPQVAYVCKTIAEALVHLHEDKMIIHRDIKAANIMMTGTGEAKLADFGLSRLFKRRVSETHSCWGTAHWMAPETMVMENYSFKADIWSLGITAFEMANGLPPNPELQLYHLNKKYRTSGPPHLPRNRKWSPEFEQFIERALVVNPADRASAAELLELPFLKNAPGRESMAPLCQKMIKIRERERAKWEKDKKKR